MIYTQCQDESSSSTSSPCLNPRASPRPREDLSISESFPNQVRSLHEIYESSNFLIFEPQSLQEAEKQENWIKAMKNKMNMIEKNNTQKLVDRPKDCEVISDKCIYKTVKLWRRS